MRSYMTQDVIDRISKISLYSNPAKGVYTLRTLREQNLKWGDGRYMGFGSDKYVTVKSHRVLVWAIAEVAACSFYTQAGLKQPLPGVKIRPLLKDEFDLAAEFLVQWPSTPRGMCINTSLSTYLTPT